MSDKKNDDVLRILDAEYADLWTPWRGVGAPPPTGAGRQHVLVRFRNGMVVRTVASDVVWTHSGEEDDIVAYLAPDIVAAVDKAVIKHAAESAMPTLGTPSATQRQEGGSHYKDCAIQPIEFIFANNIGFAEGNVVKYVTRWKSKGGVGDLKKARHYLDLLIESIEGAPEKTPS